MSTTKTLPAFQVGQDCGIAEREGKPMAAIISTDRFRQGQNQNQRDKDLKAFADAVQEMRRRASAFPPEEIDQAIKEAIAEVRQKKRGESTQKELKQA